MVAKKQVTISTKIAVLEKARWNESTKVPNARLFYTIAHVAVTESSATACTVQYITLITLHMLSTVQFLLYKLCMGLENGGHTHTHTHTQTHGVTPRAHAR